MDKSFDYYELQQYRQHIMKYSILSPKKESELAKRYKQGDKEAGQQIINANLRFVIKVSQKYFNTGHSYLEIIQEGNLGLIKALERFDPDRGIPFIYYAVWWIEAMIKTFIHKSGKAHTGRLGHARDLFSLDESIGTEDNDRNNWIDFLTDSSDVEKTYCEEERTHNLTSLFHHCFTFLSEREAYIINQRFYAEPAVTLSEIASQLGVSKERVRQLQLRSMEKIRQVLEDKGASLSELETIGSQSNKHNLLNIFHVEGFQN
jgi:RNA polymerase sigma factor (sigma-70 family)